MNVFCGFYPGTVVQAACVRVRFGCARRLQIYLGVSSGRTKASCSAVCRLISDLQGCDAAAPNERKYHASTFTRKFP